MIRVILLSAILLSALSLSAQQADQQFKEQGRLLKLELSLTPLFAHRPGT